MITVKYFASLRNLAGKDEEQLDLGNEVTVQKLGEAIAQSSPKVGEMILGKKSPGLRQPGRGGPDHRSPGRRRSRFSSSLFRRITIRKTL